MSKSESDQEDNDDLNDNDWSYRAEKKSENLKIVLNFHCADRIIMKTPPHNKQTSCFNVPAKKKKSDKVFLLLFLTDVIRTHFMLIFSVCNEVDLI